MSHKLTILIKPTHDCNLACKYCYVEQNAERGRMSYETLRNAIAQVLAIPGKKRLLFIWHGGEPTLMGLEFYDEMLRIQDSLNKGHFIENSIQTNATLLDKRLVDFFAEHGIHIGCSLDGPEGINDLTRIYPDGRGSFHDIWRGIMLVRDKNQELRRSNGRHKYLGGGPIVVLSKQNIEHLPRIYAFFKRHNISFKVNPVIRSGRASNGREDLSIGPAAYGKALVNLFDTWFYEKEQGIDVDPLSSILSNLMTRRPRCCHFVANCRESYISIGPGGDVYPCGRFDGVREFHLGNVNTGSIVKMLQSQKNVDMLGRNPTKIQGCSTCRYNALCNGGCMHNSYTLRGSITDRDFYCPSYRILYGHIEKALNAELRQSTLTTN